ncbi:glycosyltransferase family 2 protein [Flectobacillus longus]|uniref:glycosyltransferase family 2 protein n=1 Tax=Flectobacillus longus TaxID=2984207 RepID=UPI0024B81AF0|nr:glycosyltransferase family 2 protein [Flectobacillus longus]MDI9882149.1 glycosyltransferase family 2 protein [Flectobacillus longus]
MLLSVVIPVYKGAQSISLLVHKLHETLQHVSFEIVLVNDGSPDNSEEVCASLALRYPRVSFISLRRNFGEFNAVICGLNHIKGHFAVIIDDDFQNPPSEILKLLHKAQSDNLDVVYSYYEDKKHHYFRNFGSWLVNQMTSYLFEKPKNLYLSSFKLIKKEVVTEICKYTGPYPYIDALIFRVTKNVGRVLVEHHARAEGQSSYTIQKLIALFLSILFGYSLLPVRIILSLGVISLSFSFILLIAQILGLIDTGATFIAICIFGSIQTIGLGIIGEYVAKGFLTQNSHPQFVIKSKHINHAE